MKQYKLTITEQNRTVSMQSGKTMSVKDGSQYVFYGPTKADCLAQAKARNRKGRKEWEMEQSIFLVSKRGTTDTKKIRYVRAESKAQALRVAKSIWRDVNHAEDATENFSDRENLPDYVINAKEWDR